MDYLNIKLTSKQAKALHGLLPKIIKSPKMLDKREFTPTYDEIMALIEVSNQLWKR